MGYLGAALAMGMVVVILLGLAQLGGCAAETRMVCKVTTGPGSCEVEGGRRATSGMP